MRTLAVAILLASAAVSLSCQEKPVMATAYLKPASDFGPNTMFGAPAGSHWMAVNEDLAAATFPPGLTGDALDEEEVNTLTDGPDDLSVCSAIRGRFVVETFPGDGCTVAVRVWKADGTLLGTMNLVVPDNHDPLDPGPLAEITLTTQLTGLSLSKADVNGLRAGPKMPTPGNVRFYAWDFEITHTSAISSTHALVQAASGECELVARTGDALLEIEE